MFAPTPVKAWYDGLPYGRTAEKLLMIVRAILAHARSRGWIDHDPTAGIERQQVRYSGDYDFYGREEIDALVRAAATEQDGAIYLTAAMTGLRRGELVALRWRDIDFSGQAIRVRTNYSFGELVTPKSGKVRSVPMIPEVAQAIARLGQRDHFTGDRTLCSPARAAATSTRARSGAATKRPPGAPDCGDCRSTPCATTSDRWRSTAPHSYRSNRGWATPTSRPPPATSMPRAKPTTPRYWLARLPHRQHGSRRTRLPDLWILRRWSEPHEHVRVALAAGIQNGRPAHRRQERG